MADYSKLTNFASKDALLTGDPLKVIKGTEIDDELEAIETSVSTKADLASPTFTGTPKAPTAATGTETTQISTTAFVADALDNYTLPNDSVASAMIQENAITARELNVPDNGTAGQTLISDGDGSFSWLGDVNTSTVDRQTFTEDGTWTKPTSGNIAVVELWGAGGGGGSASSSLSVQGGGGGGGGSYARYEFLLSELGSTETVTIGQGGAGAAAGSYSGTAGGNTTFGTHATGYGGGGGGYPAYQDYIAGGGGGGGGLLSEGGTSGGDGVGGSSGGPSWNEVYGGGRGSYGEIADPYPVSSTYGGAGGGGSSVYGGGGGSTGHGSNTNGGGSSVYGGNGGGLISGVGQAGLYPAGGGAGSGRGIAGAAGADGKCVITVY